MAKGNKITTLPLAERAPERVQRVIQLFDQEGADPKGIARKLRFKDHRELGRFMHLHGYIWSGEHRNYVVPEVKTEKAGAPEASRNPRQEEAINEDKGADILGEVAVDSSATLPLTFEVYRPLLDFLAQHERSIRQLLTGAATEATGTIPRYTVPGTLVTKSVHMSHDLDMLVRAFSKERNITQREIFEVALVEFFRRYGYVQEVQRLLEGV